ncbi:hypothetical protein [Bacillus pinisoli]|uniref:hypothetical protein n=1 Tax=Bacillus pinisoli TaxID=2901866 RepID=UPI001FF4BAF2|nr:hypothetical protein [Bacillus pinisoli]
MSILLVFSQVLIALSSFMIFLIVGIVLLALSEVIRLLHEINQKLELVHRQEEREKTIQPLSINKMKNCIKIEDAKQILAMFQRRKEDVLQITPTPLVDYYFVETKEAVYLVELGDFLPFIVPKERWQPQLLRHFELTFAT